MLNENDKLRQAEWYRLTVTENVWIPVEPHPRQQAFLSEYGEECLFGGAAGGGKSVGILASALQGVTVPGYSALLLRRTFQDLNQPGALIPLSHSWLQGTEAKWDGRTFRWHFPNDATISFGYLDTTTDMYRYQGSAYQFIGFDELTQFPEDAYLYLFSRLRRLTDMMLPLRMRATSNPGGIGHEWVRQRFIAEGRPFVPAKLEHNPSLDQRSYEAQLDRLDPVTRAQLRSGDWNVRPEGNLFKREWFNANVIVDRAPTDLVRRVRFWDLAATEAKPGTDPDFTANVEMGIDAQGVLWAIDGDEFRATPADVERRVKDTAALDSRDVEVHIEQEPGASGKSLVDHYARNVLKGFAVYGVRSTGDKITRAKPASAAVQNGIVRFVRGAWLTRLIDRLTTFGLPGVHDDYADAFAGSHRALTGDAPEWQSEELVSRFSNFGKWRSGNDERQPSVPRIFADQQ